MEIGVSSPASSYRKAYLKEMGMDSDRQQPVCPRGDGEASFPRDAMRNGSAIWRLECVANMQTRIVKSFLGAAEVCGAQCWGARSREGRQTEFVSLEMRKEEDSSSWAIHRGRWWN